MRLTVSKAMLALAAVASVALAGCVSLFPKAEPAQLYRFGGDHASQPGAGASSAQVGLALSPIDFYTAAAGDRIMTVTGSEVAYIAGARWAVSAKVLFSDALDQAFERDARVVSLINRREMRTSNLLLDVDVNAFEARYENGREAPPTAVVAIDVRIIKFPERTVVAHRVIEVRQPASENRQSAIVAALDTATTGALKQLVEWADANAR